MDDLWIIVPHWDRFQHYKDRTPAWIKLHLEVRDRDEWRVLTYAQRGLIATIWMEFGASMGQLNARYIQHRTGIRTPYAQLKSLSDAGWIELSASKPLAIRYPRGEERRGERESASSPLARASGFLSEEEPPKDPLAFEHMRDLAVKVFP